MKILRSLSLALLLCAAPTFATVLVNSPSNGETTGTRVRFSGTASASSCGRGVASMGVYVDNSLQYVSPGASLDATLQLGPGSHRTVVEEWDYCGGASFTPVDINVSNQSGVAVVTPQPNSTVNQNANYVASATTSCPRGVAAMGVYVNNQLRYVAQGSKLNTQISLAPGPQHTVVEEWDYCGGASYSTVDVKVNGSGNVLSNLQASGGWNSWGQFAPKYDICTGTCNGVNWAMTQRLSAPSLTGNATRFDIGGTVPYSDVLWSNPVIGQNSTQGLPDRDHTLLPTVHNFIYDADVYVTNWNVTQVLEFDVSMYMNGTGMIWGQQCDHLGEGAWDIWDNVNGKWVSTGVACKLNNNAWNHVTIQMQRQPDNTLLYQSITVNGVTANINRTYAPYQVPSSWWGITLNYQMDGNYRQESYNTFVDNLNLTYW